MSTQRQPKGIPSGGQFAESAHDEASSSLAAPVVFDREAEASKLEREIAEAETEETAAHFARAAEQYAMGHSSDSFANLEFDDQDGQVTFWTPDGEMIEDDSMYDVLPEHIRNGRVEVDRTEDGYSVVIEDFDDDGQRYFYELKTDNNDIEALTSISQHATEKRAALRDAREKVAIIDAFETADFGSGGDGSITFEPKEQELLDGTSSTLQVPGGFAIAPSNEWEARAFAFAGQGVKRVSVRRDGGDYIIERTVKRPISDGEEVLTDRVSPGSVDRWTRGSL